MSQSVLAAEVVKLGSIDYLVKSVAFGVLVNLGRGALLKYKSEE